MLTDTGLRLERYMDRLSLRQSLTAANIANADTPGYKTKDVDFQSELASVIETPGLVTRNDGNNVSVDRESRMLSENAMRFAIASNLLQTQTPRASHGDPGRTRLMSLFSVLSVSASGMAAQRTRAEIVAENLANADTTRTPDGGPYRRRDVVFESILAEEMKSIPQESPSAG